MHENPLKKLNILKIYLNFLDGNKIPRKEEVSLKTFDEKYCYFSGPSHFDLIKPKWRTKAEIIIYTSDGVYRGVEIIHEVDFALEMILYNVALPKKWEYIQYRVSPRKMIELPVKLEFDDLNIESKIFDLSSGGFSVCAKEDLTNLQMRFLCKCSIRLPEGFESELLEAAVKYVRKELIIDDYDLIGYKKYSFKFVNLTPDKILLLRNLLSNNR